MHVIHAFLDGYNLEVFADERVAITTNLFPTLRESVCVGVDVSAAGATIASLDAWALAPDFSPYRTCLPCRRRLC